MFDIENLDLNGIKFNLVSVDKNQITFTNASTFRDYLDMHDAIGKNKLKYNVFNLTMFYRSVNTGYKSKLYKAILTKGNMNDGYKLVFDTDINTPSKLVELFKKHKIQEKLK